MKIVIYPERNKGSNPHVDDSLEAVYRSQQKYFREHPNLTMCTECLREILCADACQDDDLTEIDYFTGRREVMCKRCYALFVEDMKDVHTEDWPIAQVVEDANL